MVQAISIFVSLLFFIQVLYYTSKNKLQDQQALLWLILSAGGVLLAVFLPYMNAVARVLGVQYMPSLVFVIAFLIMLTVLVFQTTTITKQQSQIKQIAQQLAYAMKHIDELREELNKGDHGNGNK